MITSPAFAGVTNILHPKNIIRQEVEEGDIAADIEAEQGTLPELNVEDIEECKHQDAPASLSLQWEQTISSASRGVSDNTDKEYQRYISQKLFSYLQAHGATCLEPLSSLINLCITFLISKNLITKREDFLSKSPLEDSPEFIIAWIMHE